MAALCVALPQASQAAEQERPRIEVVDGDSIAVDGVEWRLIGFDTPEIGRAQCEGERRTGLLAKRRLRQMLDEARAAGTAITVEDSGERDRYKRPLGTLRIAGRDVGEQLVAELYARPYNGGRKKGWCSRDSRDDLIPGPRPAGRSK